MAQKKGPYRKVVKVEMTSNYGSMLKSGTVVEMHPELYKQVVAAGAGKKTTLPLGRIAKKGEKTPPPPPKPDGEDA